MDKPETWKPILEGVYEVSDLGNVRRVKSGKGSRVGKNMKKPVDSSGYPNISFCIEGKRFTKRLHVIVASSFIGDREPGMEVNHIDGNKQNCQATNLEYVTKSENGIHAYATGLNTKNKTKRLTRSDALLIRGRCISGMSQGKVAKEFGIDQGCVSRIVNNKIWKEWK